MCIIPSQWLGGHSRRRPTPARNEERPPPSPTGFRVSVGRVERRTKHNDKLLRPCRDTPWRKGCSDYTQHLLRLIGRNERLRLHQERLENLDQHWTALQRLIDRKTLGHTVDAFRNDRSRDTHLSRERSLQRAIWDQQKLSSQRASLKILLRAYHSVQVSEEDAAFMSFEWIMKHCAKQNGCLAFTETLAQSFRAAAEVRDLVRQTEEQLLHPRGEFESLEDALRVVTAATPERDRAVAAVRRVARRLEELGRVLIARQQWRAEILDDLYTLARATMVEQELTVPEHTEAKGAQTEPAQPGGSVGPAKQTDGLTAKDLDDYESAYDCVLQWREDHDNMRDPLVYDEELAKYLEENPEKSESDFGAEWARRRSELANTLNRLEEALIKTRDKALQGGAASHMLGEEGYDKPEFAGDRAEDGKIGCMSAATLKYFKQKAEKDKPRWTKWVKGTKDGVPATEQEMAEEREWVRRECGEDDDGPELQGDIRPDDSFSQIKSRPRARKRIDKCRRTHEDGSDE